MAIQLPTKSLSTPEFDTMILSFGTIKDVCNWSRVCTIWNAITSEDSFLRQIAPTAFTKGEHGIKECLNLHAVRSEDAMMERFKKLLKNVQPYESFSFVCSVPFSPSNLLVIKRLPESVDAHGEMRIDHEDFCVIMAPFWKERGFVESNQEKQISRLGSTLHIRFFDYFTEEQYERICDQVDDIMLKHDYPYTSPFRKVYRALRIEELAQELSERYQALEHMELEILWV